MLPALRYIFLVPLVYLWTTPPALFQTEQPLFRGGFTAGMNASEVIGDAYHGFHKAGLHAGILAYAWLNPVSVSLELLYTQKGSRGVREAGNLHTGTFYENYSLKLDYIEIPLLLHLSIYRQSHIGIGLSYAQLIRQKESFFSDQPIPLPESLYHFQKSDLAAIADIHWHLGKGWFAGFRYQRSLRPIRKHHEVPPTLGWGDQYNTWVTLRIMYLLGDSGQRK